MRVSAKGQITIPKKVRDQASLPEGTEIEFEVQGNAVVLRRARPGARRGLSRGQQMVEALKGTATANTDLSTDQIMQLLRGDD